jgi:hypothetical protein
VSAVVNRAGQTQLLQTARELAECTLLCADGDIGGIEEFLFDDATWVVRYLVVTPGAGPSGRRALVAPVAVGGVDATNKTICIELTSVQIENSPPIDTRGGVSRQDEADYYNYYHWPPYWEAGPSPGLARSLTPRARMHASATGPTQMRLRSTTALTGYSVATGDGDIGVVDNVIVDTRYWAIRYLEVDTGQRWSGRPVLVHPGWIERVSWTDRTMSVDLVREAIKAAPAFDPSRAVSRDYEARLFRHYGRLPYWKAATSLDRGPAGHPESAKRSEKSNRP